MNASGGAMNESAWQRVDLTDPVARQALAADIAEIRAAAGEPGLFHDLAWLLEAEGRSPDDVQIYVCRAAGGLRAYAPFVVQPWVLRFRVGEITLFSRALERLHINHGPIIAASGSIHENTGLVADLLARLRPLLADGRAVYLEGVVAGGAVDGAVAAESIRRMYRVVEPSPRYERRLIRLPDSFDEYLNSLTSSTRQGLRRQRRKLEAHVAGSLKLVRYVDIDQMVEFVNRAVAVSKKTYQWNLLELGLRRPEELQQTLTAMARHGWTRCYLLECNGVATAFMIGYLYAGTYYYVDVGFDPDWEKWSVGTVLHMEVLRDLIEDENRARSFDFSSGSGIHKERFSNESRMEFNYLLLPRSVRNAVLVGAFRAINAVSATAVLVLDRLHLKAAIKRLARKHATGRTTAD